jgi:hypothetical protein
MGYLSVHLRDIARSSALYTSLRKHPWFTAALDRLCEVKMKREVNYLAGKQIIGTGTTLIA